MAKKVILTAQSPLGYEVVLTRNRWREIIRYKHPAMKNQLGHVEDCLLNPKSIRRSEKDPNTHLYYRKVDRIYTCVVVALSDPTAAFVVTCYYSRNIKKGEELWAK